MPLNRFCSPLAIIVFAASMTVAAAEPEPLRLTLPAHWFAVVGQEMSLYYDNVVLTETPENDRFGIECNLAGESGERCWKVTPTAKDAGDHSLTVTVSDAAGTVLGRASTSLRVIPANAGAGRQVALLIVGDSLTHATAYPNAIASLLSQPENPKWQMLGTHRPAGAQEGVAPEGYGGWTWARFTTHYEPNPDGTYNKRSSPFVFLGGEKKPVLDVARYLDESFGGKRPTHVTFLLGINDCFGADPEVPSAIDERIDVMFAEADKLVAAFRSAAPEAELGICLTTPPNARESVFEANYKGRFHRWGWKRIQHRLVEREIAKFAGREAENTFVVPTELNIDPVDGYPENNGVHPNAFGYKQIGASIYAWLKSRLRGL